MEKIIEDHWKWLKGFIDTLDSEIDIGMATLEYIYKTAFEHGMRHADKHIKPT